MDTECAFCGIAIGMAPASRVYEDARVVAFLDLHPITEGHTLVVPVAHVPSLEDLDPETGRELFSVAQRVAAALLRSELRCEGVNLFLADGEAAGQEVFHTHLHVFPRYRGDGFQIRAVRDLPNRRRLDEVASLLREAVLSVDQG